LHHQSEIVEGLEEPQLLQAGAMAGGMP